jgi:hypothetical protein
MTDPRTGGRSLRGFRRGGTGVHRTPRANSNHSATSATLHRGRGHDAPESQVRHPGVGSRTAAGGGAVALAVGGVAEERTAPRHALGTVRVVRVPALGRSKRIGRDVPASILRVRIGSVPVGAPLPDVAGRVVQTEAVRGKRPLEARAEIPVSQVVRSGNTPCQMLARRSPSPGGASPHTNRLRERPPRVAYSDSGDGGDNLIPGRRPGRRSGGLSQCALARFRPLCSLLPQARLRIQLLPRASDRSRIALESGSWAPYRGLGHGRSDRFS